MPPMIEGRELVKDYGDFRAVDKASFSVEKGKIFGFLGPNGAGKTTTIKMLTTVLRPTSGAILIDGRDSSADPLNARRAFGIVFQDQSIDDELTAIENMELHGVLYGIPSAERKARTEKLLKFVELWDRRDDKVDQFSGGMTRRLEIARALLHEPKIIFLDEPTAGLDPQTRNKIWTFIKDLSRERGTTVFFTTHYMEEAERVADEIAIIDRGRIQAGGAPAKIMADAGAPSLEEAFIQLTGREIRAEEASAADSLRQQRRLWGRKR